MGRAGSRTSRVGTVAAYGLAHAAVDATCAATIYFAAATGGLPLALALPAVIAYNLLAFASQPLAGWFVNDIPTGRWVAVGGGVLVAAALPLAAVPGGLWPAIAVAGIGNAVFHVGGGVVSLLLEPGRATLPGVFVAPGAAGLAAGIALGSTVTWAWVPVAVLALSIAGLTMLRTEELPGDRPMPLRAGAAALLPLALLLAVIGLRSFVGAGVPMPWKADATLLAWLTAAVVGGKALGGVLADRFGWMRVGVASLAASLPLLYVAGSYALAGIAGMLLFNMTMPITLVAVVGTVPERPGFGFGLTCLALVTAALPLLAHLLGGVTGPSLAAAVAASAVLLAVALRAAGASGVARMRSIGEGT